MALALAAEEVTILKQTSDVGPETFEYAYETSDGVNVQASGDANSHRGSYKYTSPEGTPIEISYIADENGFQATGDAVPATPDHVVKLLEYIRTHPSAEDRRRR